MTTLSKTATDVTYGKALLHLIYNNREWAEGHLVGNRHRYYPLSQNMKYRLKALYIVAYGIAIGIIGFDE